MYGRFKYVVGEIITAHGTQLGAVIIPETVDHKSLRNLFKPGSIRSAGFGAFAAEDVGVWGESVGLGVKCNPELDKRLVGRAVAHPKYET